MRGQDEAALDILRAHIGHEVSRVLRHHYEFRGTIDRESGDVEIWFNDRVAWLSCAANGQDLRVSAESWKDPFAPPLSPENEAYVKESGRWIAMDVSNEAPYAQIVGHSLDDVTPVLDEWQHFVGVRLRIGTKSFQVSVDGDELLTTFAPATV